MGGDLAIVQRVYAIGVDNLCINPVIRIELLNWLSGYTFLTKPERATILRFIKNISLLHLNTEISALAISLSDADINSKRGDTLIAATALHYGLPMMTLNRKDYTRLGVPLV